MTDEFERGVRFVMAHHETYRKGSGPNVTQFGDYQMTMEPDPKPLLDGSQAHRERRIQAVLFCARQNEDRS